jgi:outer membrane protein, heavy metal efflux system
MSRQVAASAMFWLLVFNGAPLAASQPPAAPGQDFRQVLAEVLNQHPALRAARQRLAGSQAWARGAGAQPNPQLRLAVPAGDPSEEANSLVQRLEIGGQPGLRSKIAQLQVQQADARVLRQQRELGMRAAEAYYTLWSTRETERLLELRVELARTLQAASERRLQAGEIAENQYLRAELERAQAEAQLAHARGERKMALNRLNILLQRPADQGFVLNTGPVVEESLAEPTRESLQQNIDGRPEVRVAQLQAEIAQLEADLLGKQRVPDLEFEAYRSSLGHNAEQGVRVSLVLPLWDWGSTGAAVQQRQREAEAAQTDVLVQRQAIEQEVLAAWELYLAERERRQILRGQTERFLKQADLARRGYEAGLLTLLEVLEAQRAYREAMLEYVAAETAFQKRRWDVYWLSGGQFLDSSQPEEVQKEKSP